MKTVSIHNSVGAYCEINLYGATITSWKCNSGIERLYLSSKAVLNGDKAIRGGIPLVFPQFGTGSIMTGQHGFARCNWWNVVDKSESNRVLLELQQNESTLLLWPHNFSLMLVVSIDTDGALDMEFHVRNQNENASFEFQFLFHSYFCVSDISAVRVKNLSGCNFIDKLRNNEKFDEVNDTLAICSEVDSIYESVPNDVFLNVDNTSIRITKSNELADLVVWNPWIEKSKTMNDFAEGGHLKMVCLEAGCLVNKPVLSAGEKWSCKQRFEVVK